MDILDQDDLFIPLPDGTRLAARLWRPRDGAKVPAILEYIPYRKRDNTLPRDETMHPWMAAQGYACLRVDIRGTGDSEGVFDDEYSAQELRDACDVIAWIAAQDWCTGAVGMMGKSWGGFNCLQTAFLQPPALKAVVSVCATVDRFADDIHYKGGCLLGENFGWGTLMLSYCARPADPLLRPDWRQDLRNRIATMPNLSERWSQQQERGAYWDHGSVGTDYSRLKAAILTIGGWNDNYMNAPAALVANAPMAKAILGPWVHQYPHTAVPAPRIDFLAEMKAWWDRWLKGIDNGADRWPGYRAYMLDSAPPDPSAPHRPGTWIAQDSATAQATWRDLPLGDGVLGGTLAKPVTIATPQTLGVQAGEFFPMGLNAEMAGDQRLDDALSVCFDLPCPDGLALMGAARLRVTVDADQPHAFLVARLCDVAPDGSSVRIAHGILNLQDPAEAPGTGPIARAPRILDLDQMAYRLAPGHTLRLALSNTYWPWIWPSPRPVTVTLHGGSLALPVHPGTGDGWTFAEPAAVPPARLKDLGGARESRVVSTDQITGVQTIRIESDSALSENPDHGLQTRATMTETWTIHPDDPLTARCAIRWTQVFRRGDWAVETEVEATQSGTETDLVLDATLVARLSEPGHDVELLTRNFHARVARQRV